MTSLGSSTQSPARRLSWPVTHWPEGEQVLWRSACEGRGTWGEDNPAYRWSSSWLKMIESGFGRYVGWIAPYCNLEAAEPGQLICPEAFTDFTSRLAADGLAPASIANFARCLRAYTLAVDPEGDWQWLSHRAFRLKARAVPTRDKALRVVHSSELYKLGMELMDNACSAKSQKRAAGAFRDGLMISLLAARPLRLSNFSDIAMGRTLILRRPTYWLAFSELETKTARPISLPIPNALCDYVDEYLMSHRKLLLSMRPVPAAPTTALWISNTGDVSTPDQIRAAINHHTKLAFGRSINPHLFRDCLATTMATDDPEAVLCVVPLLGHASFKTMEQTYNHASMLTAARDFASEIMQCRNEMLRMYDLDDVRSFLLKAESGQVRPL